MRRMRRQSQYCFGPALRQAAIVLGALGFGFLSLSAAAASQPVPVGSRRQLLLDERFVQQRQGVEFVVHSPQKTGDQCIVSEPGQSLGGYHSVLFEGGVYHLWYTAGGNVLYARSSDGIHWEKPSLNLAPAGAGTNSPLPSNLVMGQGVGGPKGCTA